MGRQDKIIKVWSHILKIVSLLERGTDWERRHWVSCTVRCLAVEFVSSSGLCWYYDILHQTKNWNEYVPYGTNSNILHYILVIMRWEGIQFWMVNNLTINIIKIFRIRVHFIQNDVKYNLFTFLCKFNLHCLVYYICGDLTLTIGLKILSYKKIQSLPLETIIEILLLTSIYLYLFIWYFIKLEKENPQKDRNILKNKQT